jgi:hypothetical protein
VATSPTIPMHARTIIAATYDLSPRLETRIVPATAAEGRTQIRDGARQARDLALELLGEGGLHNVDGRGQHHSDPRSGFDNAHGELPEASRPPDHECKGEGL